MKNGIKAIRVIVYSVVLLILMGVVCDVIIVKVIDSMKIRNIIVLILGIVFFLIVVILAKNQKLVVPRVIILDVLSIAMLMVLIVGAFAHMRKESPIIAEMADTFPGNNGFGGSISNGIGNKGYYAIEKALENAVKNETSNFNKLEEIYHIQVGDRIFVYNKKDEKQVIEFSFLKEDDLYYSIGNKCLYVLYDNKYSGEETIRHDIVFTMWREGKWDEMKLGAPAWGVSTDEQISSMTVNSEKVDDVILVDEIDGKKYYFWIMTNVGEIETVDDVKAAKIEMNGLYK